MRVAARTSSTVTPPSIHGKMRFPLNSGQTNAVKTRPRLGGGTVGLPKTRREEKPIISEILWHLYGLPMDSLWTPYGLPMDSLWNNTVATPCQHQPLAEATGSWF